MFRKLTLKEAVDFLEQLIDEDENEVFGANIDTIYLQPPYEDGNVSGEDDAGENEGGLIDNVCRAQLMTGCEVVLRNGDHVNTVTFEDTNGPSENITENVLVDIITEAACDLCDDQPLQMITCEQIETSEADSSLDEALNKQSLALKARKAKENAKKQHQIAEMESRPIVNRLRKVQPSTSNVPIPATNKETRFTWVNETESCSLPIFPEPNFDDCRDKKPHELFELFFDDTLLQHIIDCSSRYAVKNMDRPVDEITIAGKIIRIF